MWNGLFPFTSLPVSRVLASDSSFLLWSYCYCKLYLSQAFFKSKITFPHLRSALFCFRFPMSSLWKKLLKTKYREVHIKCNSRQPQDCLVLWVNGTVNHISLIIVPKRRKRKSSTNANIQSKPSCASASSNDWSRSSWRSFHESFIIRSSSKIGKTCFVHFIYCRQ